MQGSRGRRRQMALALVFVLGLLPLQQQVAGAEVRNEPHSHVVGGRDADADEYPFIAALLTAGEEDRFQAQFCGGSVVDTEWVLTAAHCVVDEGGQVRPAETIDVLVGTSTLSTGGTRIPVAEVVSHPEYDPQNVLNDIALLRLTAETGLPAVGLVAPGEEALWEPGDVGTVIGWGGLRSNEEQQVYPDRLQEGEVPVRTDADCQREVGGYDPVVMLCAGVGTAEQEDTDPCRGDSGGPLLFPDTERWVLVGLVSYGATCGNTPSAYTRVLTFIAWIDGVLGDAPAGRFVDVDQQNPHLESIEDLADMEVVGGYPDNTYRPANAVTREQMAAFLSRGFGYRFDPPPSDYQPFSDIDGSLFFEEIRIVAYNGVALGSDGRYNPKGHVTRAQMAAFLNRVLQLPAGDGSSFADTRNHPLEAEIDAVADAGIALGGSDGLFRPGASVRRDQMASFIWRALAYDVG